MPTRLALLTFSRFLVMSFSSLRFIGHWPILRPMDFEWDEAKSDACFAHRGFDFAYAVRAFLDPNRIAGRDRRWDYGEDRYRLLAAIEGRMFVLIYTMRDSAIRIISARKANGKEIREYEYKTRED